MGLLVGVFVGLETGTDLGWRALDVVQEEVDGGEATDASVLVG